MTNREQYERMIYLENDEVMLLLDALLDTWYHWEEPRDDDAMKLYRKIKQHYKIQTNY